VSIEATDVRYGSLATDPISRQCRPMSAVIPIADIRGCGWNVRFVPQADMRLPAAATSAGWWQHPSTRRSLATYNIYGALFAVIPWDCYGLRRATGAIYINLIAVRNRTGNACFRLGIRGRGIQIDINWRITMRSIPGHIISAGPVEARPKKQTAKISFAVMLYRTCDCVNWWTAHG
jgi:hypothetical protein